MGGNLAISEFVSLFVRWAHVVAAISWIGSSFYFMWLDASLKRRAAMPKGVKGENWTVHGGGFYHTQKYMVAPASMPDDLHWFKWESYATWLSGAVLLAVVYYWNASLYLLDPQKATLLPWQGIVLSAGGLVAGWLVYDGLCRSPLAKRPLVLFGVLFALITLTAYLYGLVFSGRAAFIQTGAMIATAMTGNVFLVIIPNQKVVVADLKAGRTPDARYGEIAKLRSTHNNYLTLPVIFLMLSNHAPSTYGNANAWAIVAIALILGAVVRHWFNTYETGAGGAKLVWQWPTAVGLALAMMVFASVPGRMAPIDLAVAASRAPDETGAFNLALEPLAFEIVTERCASCHATAPTFPAFSAPPGGVAFDTPQMMRRHAQAIIAQSVDTHVMPLGNITNMTQDERAVLAAWVARQ
ncbi:MAG: urate hydroxylase PuuD [Pseudomonadota bacterium]